ncbi:creatininase family protein [Agromyces bauzanensis]
MTRRVDELSGDAASAVLGPDSVIVLPTGAVEHHGPHLPLGTDHVMADAVATAAVQRSVARGVDAWLLPPLAYTKSDEHSWAPGTMWLTAETLMATLVDLGRSLTTTRARKLVFLNGHGGNVALLNVAIRELRRRFGLQTFVMGFPMPPGDGVDGPDELGLGIHGGHGETSLMLHLRPELVDLSLARRSVPEHLAEYRRIGFHSKPVTLGWLSNDFDPSGVIGDPTGANAAHGAALFEHAVEESARSLEEIARFEPRRGAEQ